MQLTWRVLTALLWLISTKLEWSAMVTAVNKSPMNDRLVLFCVTLCLPHLKFFLSNNFCFGYHFYYKFNTCSHRSASSNYHTYTNSRTYNNCHYNITTNNTNTSSPREARECGGPFPFRYWNRVVLVTTNSYIWRDCGVQLLLLWNGQRR